MSDEEVDYMSDAVLMGGQRDIRPGLVYQSSLKRKYEAEKRQEEARRKNYIKPKRVLEAESRDTALGTAITKENKGFQMLQRMGYKPGTNIGKLTKDDALIEPIKPVLKVGRSGLGKDEEVKRGMKERVQREMDRHMQRVRNVEKITTDYMVRVREKQNEQKTAKDLYHSQKVCYQIENQTGIETPSKTWFWPAVVQDSANNETDEEDDAEQPETEDDALEPLEKLEELTNHLRTNYFYCIWCGTRFDGEEDIRLNCPGSTAEDHD